MTLAASALHALGVVIVTVHPLGAPAAKTPASRALVFAQNPVRTPEPSEQVLSLSPTRERLAHPWLEAFSCVLPSSPPFPSSDGGFPPERFCVLQSTARPDARRVYAARPRLEPDASESSPDAFAEASLFFHAAATLSYFRDLGWSPPWPDTRPALRLVANVRMPSRDAGSWLPWNDALFVPASHPRTHDTLWFGQGPGVNLAYDGDTIAHEVTHALLEPLLPRGDWRLDASGANGAPGAIDEGLADYFAAARSGDPFIGEYAVSGADTGRSRNIHAQTHCPEELVGRRHGDGLLLSSALWAVREPASTSQRAALDRAVLAALRSPSAASSLSFEWLLDTLVTTLTPEHPGLARAAREEFSRRGLLPACPRVLELEPGQSRDGTSGSFLSPGISTLGVKGLAPGVLQFHVRVPEGTRALSLRFRSSPARRPADGRSTPFQPVVLARRDRPLQWSYEPEARGDAEQVAEPLGTSSRLARIELPGASDVFLQIANAGEQDGWYDTLAIAFETDAFETEPPPSPAGSVPDRSDSPSLFSRLLWGGLAGGAVWGGWRWWRRRKRTRGPRHP